MSQQCHICSEFLTVRYGSVEDPQTREKFSIAVCPSCGLGHTLPRPDDVGRYYGHTYYGGRHSFTAEFCAHRRMRIVNGTARGRATRQQRRRLLDVGCGDGTFLLSAQANGWQVTGVEINPQIARRAGLNVYGSVEEVPGDGPRFDSITLWHSLEHMPYPANMIKQLASLLAPNGTMIVAVPNAGGWQARLFASKWFHLDVPRHLYHFRFSSLEKALTMAGLSIGRLWHQEFEYDLFGWSQSALNVMLPTPNVFFSALTGRRSRAKRGERAVSLGLGPLLSVAAVPAVIAGTMSRQGGTLIVSASHAPTATAPPA